ncbi:XTP/dITP diphosphatase [Pyrobaculum neutrophilum]|uniref:dITP/XTP pyrophosphatase n=1 Tax=Pyrobaculum neutrophilum (strain DSM 2338 / JCM 9278 / NBRC 100436 / V24Sta) TaxID=444157 RepID=B1Y9K1_PYRNV|nr:XTP/dITP diphosphatase [Pyrobaculum neutrophilum]ACB40430.1 non-canonical purine NTP pyrophosphatase, rdgB/HAM1 family [Pyrobaculum neutrophilum V24Sta]
MRIRVATGNPHKISEISQILKPLGIAVERLEARKIEVQDDDVVNVAKHAAEALCRDYGDNVVVEDTGLYVDALGGFPGPYAEYVYRTIGLRGLLKLLEGVENRSAVFRCAAALCVGGDVKVFLGETRGRISEEPRGSGGFGFDPVFIPEGFDKTYAELGDEVKNRVSHRAKAFISLGNWLLTRRSL